jgi:hypothetical protein
VLTGRNSAPATLFAADRHLCMARSLPIAALVAATVLAGTPALAQLPNIFETLFGPPPRPPADVPRSNLPPPPAGFPRSDLPPPERLPPGSPPYGSPGRGVQTEPLPPPPGARVPFDARQQQDVQVPGAPGQTLPGLAPGQRQTRGTPAAVGPQPGDEVVTAPPAVKIVNPTAVFSGLDKITGRITAFDVAINETVRFGALEVTPRACYTRPPTETANTDGFVEVDELTLQGELRRIFTGWMFAASPGLNAVEHPIYDVWLTDCKGGETAPAAEVAAEPAPAPPQRRPPQRRATAPAPQAPPPAAPRR